MPETDNEPMLTFKYKIRRKMKKYYVARLYGNETLLPNILFQSESREDADKYAALMRKSDGRDYVVLVTI